MLITAKDYEDFYLTRTGRMLRDIVRHEIRKTWPNVKGSRMLGYGYAYPYLDLFYPESEICFGVSRPEMGALHWPDKKQNGSGIAASTALPFETAFFDNLILTHALEHAGSVRSLLQEAWRVLRGNGRMILVIPNRSGLWSRAAWSPFGVGTPYSRGQIVDFLTEESFDIESVRPALFTLPSQRQFTHKMAPTLEKIGPYIMPGLAGVYIIECTKKLYARSSVESSAKAANNGRWIYVPKPMSSVKKER
jgi:SAM-dependent methyltransferase